MIYQKIKLINHYKTDLTHALKQFITLITLTLNPMDKRIESIKQSSKNPYYSRKKDEFTNTDVKTLVIDFLRKHKIKNYEELEQYQSDKAEVLHIILSKFEDKLKNKAGENFHKAISRNWFTTICELLTPYQTKRAFNEIFVIFVEVFFEINTSSSTSCNNFIQNEDHTTPIDTNDFKDLLIDRYKSECIPTHAIELDVEIQESLFNHYTNTKPQAENKFKFKTNSASPNKILKKILDFKQLTFITGSYNSDISQLAKWICKQTFLQENHTYPLPVYINLSGKVFKDLRYCLEDEIISQYYQEKDRPLFVKICELLTKSDQFKLIIDGVDTLSDVDQKYYLPRQLQRINQTDCIILTRKGSRMLKQYPWVNQVTVLETETKTPFKNVSNPQLYIEELEFKYSQNSNPNNTAINNEQVEYKQKEFKSIILQAQKFACQLLKRRSHEFKNEAANQELKSLALQLQALELGYLTEVKDSDSWRFHFLSPKMEEYLISCHIERKFDLDSIITLAFETQTLSLALELLQRKSRDSEFISTALQELKERYENCKDIKYHYLFFIFMTHAVEKGNNDIKDIWTNQFGQDFISTFLSSIERKKWHYFLSESIYEIFKQLNKDAKVELIELIITNLKNKYQEYIHKNLHNNKVRTEINCLIQLLDKIKPDVKINVFDSYKKLIVEVLHQLKEENLDINVQTSVFDSIFHNILKFFKGADFNTILELSYQLKRDLISNVPEDISPKEIIHNQKIQNLIKHLNSPDFLIQCAYDTLENEIDCWLTTYDPVPNKEDTALLTKHLTNLTNIFFKIASDKRLDKRKKINLIPIIIKGVETINELPKPYRNEEALNKIYEAYQLLDLISIDASIAFFNSIHKLDLDKFTKNQITDLLNRLKGKPIFDNAFSHIARNYEIPYQFLGSYLEKLAKKITRVDPNSYSCIRMKQQLREIVRNDKTGWASIECLRKSPYNSENDYLNNVMNIILEESNFHSTNVWSIVEKYACSKDTFDIFISILSDEIRYKDRRNILPIILLWTNYPQLSSLQYEKLDTPVYLLLKAIQIHKEQLDNNIVWNEILKSLTEIINKVQTTSNNKKDVNTILRELILYSLSQFNESCIPSPLDINQYTEEEQIRIKEEILEIFKAHELAKMKSIFTKPVLEDLIIKAKDRNMDQWAMLNEKMEGIVFNNELINV